ncbi:MAG TPA: glycosyltransferase [Solirubrobacteraceae bacterium]|nr:glycosyltransferase [Solirubrobacteraceae bacterium]
MSVYRRPGAPRLIEWTGERCVPWAPDVQVVYEHLHRYAWAAQWVEGLRVLDLASGEGFGAAILADAAASVIGVDIDPAAVEHSRLNYDSPRLAFEVGDALDLARLADGEFGAVIAFEVIEHLEDHARLLAEIRRVLRPGGLLIMSTPDRGAYAATRGTENPYHVHELDAVEFRQLLAGQFANVRILGQRTVAGSALHQMDAAGASPAARTMFVEREGDEWRRVELDSPVYLVAMASDEPLPATPVDSVLADVGLGIIEAERERIFTQYARGDRDVDEQDGGDAGLVRELARRDLDLIEARRHIQHLQESLVSLQQDYGRSIQLMRRVEESVTWNAFQRLRRRAFGLMGGEDSRRVRALQWTLRALGRRRRGAGKRRLAVVSPGTSRRERPEFPQFDAPQVSIVIPVFRRADLTRRCLTSILEHTSDVPYEIILVDDASDAGNQSLLAAVQGARLIVNRENLGYLRSVNRGAAEARGRWLVLANNDIEAQPGWLRELVRCGESGNDIAVVTPRYLYPDGSLNEAGGIVWSDGTGANYGRGDHADSWRYGYRRDVDYGSAAALLVRTDFWRERGGYDETFLPMYYEDTDLCFDARERGLRVVYEPDAIVIHHEGATAGTDTSTGHKRHQDENRLKFIAKWNGRLPSEHRPPPESSPSPRALRRGTQPHVLIVDHRIPTPDRDSGSLRMQTIIEILIQAGCRVTFLPDNLHAIPPYARRLARQGVAVIHGPVDPVQELMELGPTVDVALLSRVETASRWLADVRQAAPQATIVYDTVDLHWLREARRHWHEHGISACESDQDLGDIGEEAAACREQELAIVRGADVTLVVSDVERERVELDVPEADVRVISNIHRIGDRVTPRVTRSGVLFVGGFEHLPNVEAVMRLVRDVMPRVWEQLPALDVMVVGPDPPPAVQALGSDRVKITGWVPELEPLLDSVVALLAPISYGAGVKGKVTQAMAAGLPVVTTPTGAEGVGAVTGEHLLVGGDDQELAQAVVRLVNDAELWARLSRAGQALMAEHYSIDAVRGRVMELVGIRRATVSSA